ncbi:MAG: DM13 domain-containing protein [Ornithinimicrobium sp.]
MVAAAVGLLILRRRAWLLPLGVSYLLVAGGAGVVLGLPLITDDVVNEQVIQVAPTPGDSQEAGPTSEINDESAETTAEAEATGIPETPGTPEPTQERATAEAPAEEEGPQAIAQGSFGAVDHPGSGQATVIDTGEGSIVLTLTDFATDNGPDLFVYLVPDTAGPGSVDGFVDVGSLKGNVGDQQYDVPDDVGVADGWRVIVWCRAFAVTFTEATLG